MNNKLRKLIPIQLNIKISEQPAQLHSHKHPNLHNKLITISYSKKKKLTNFRFYLFNKDN